MNIPQGQQIAADAAATVSVSAAGYSWLVAANQAVQVIAGIVAIVAGCMAAWFHWTRTQALRRKIKQDERADSSP